VRRHEADHPVHAVPDRGAGGPAVDRAAGGHRQRAEQLFAWRCRLIPDNSWYITALQVLTRLTAGTAFVMYLGELVTQRGIGNGMSRWIFASIISQLPSQGRAAPNRATDGEVILGVALLIVPAAGSIGVVYVEQAQRRIRCRVRKRQVGRAPTATSTYSRLK
jgi:preprotein translocase subunit SecY